jgi:hypothetical protein
MAKARTQVYFLPADGSVTRAFRTGVSLHSHTEHSQERLGDLPRYLDRLPVVAQFLQWERKRYHAKTGRAMDFSRAYWRGPLCARSAHDVERQQIEGLGLGAIVSLTDHDNIEAGLLLQQNCATEEIPVSVEWTVPFGQSYFHVGIHNLEPARAVAWMQALADYSREPKPAELGNLLEALDGDPGVLIVLNHPLWDMAGIGSTRTFALVKLFLRIYGCHIHALEINGLRSWQENLGAVSLAKESDHSVVAGGDRHGLEPNATINLTRATTFKEFAAEIRLERSSDIAVLPQYKEPLAFRHLLCAWDAVRDHPQFVDKQRWEARVFVVCDDGVERPLSAVWKKGTPAWIDPCLNVVGLLANPHVRTAARLASQATGGGMP